jgi:ABC-type thiamin/hydroxymethylpyrimidine transport system permease subunit
MGWTGPLAGRLSRTWRYGLLGGVLALPFTALSYARTGGELTLGVVFWGGLLAGYLAKRRGLAGTPAGTRAGVVGGVPALWMVADLSVFVAGLGGPAWFRAVQLAVLVLWLPLVVGLSALVGGLGGRAGGWIAERSGHPRKPVADTA